VLQSIWQNFGGGKYLCKLGKEYLNVSLCKYAIYSLQHSETFDVSHVFLPLTTAELSMLKKVRFFGPPCSYVLIHCGVIQRGINNDSACDRSCASVVSALATVLGMTDERVTRTLLPVTKLSHALVFTTVNRDSNLLDCKLSVIIVDL